VSAPNLVLLLDAQQLFKCCGHIRVAPSLLSLESSDQRALRGVLLQKLLGRRHLGGVDVVVRTLMSDKRWKHERKFETSPASRGAGGLLSSAVVPWPAPP
jgi:hypothetical protein